MTAALQPIAPHPADIEGRIDAITGGRLYGWAWDRSRPADHLEVEIRAGDRIIGTAFANQPRDDLKANGVGDGCHAFELPVELEPGEIPVAVARSPVTGEEMPLPQATDAEAAQEAVLGPTLLRLSALMDGTQQTQQTVLRGLRELMKQGQSGGQNIDTLDRRLGSLVAGVEALEKQVSGIEVFLMRIDESLHELHKGLGRRQTSGGDKPLRVVVAALVVVGLAVGAGVLTMGR